MKLLERVPSWKWRKNYRALLSTTNWYWLCKHSKHGGPKRVSTLFQNFGNLMKPEFVSKSHKLFMAYDIIHQCHLGAFNLLPLGMRVLEKLIKVIDMEMEAIDAQKVQMPSLIPKELWVKTGRWEAAGPELIKLSDRHNKNYCLGPTHEEVITELISHYNISKNRIPLRLYQITRKFRDEYQPKHGLLRGREFEMKDLYTFDGSLEDARLTYEAVTEAYDKIFKCLELDYIKAFGATGNIGGSLSHEFHLHAEDAGEDFVYICKSCNYSGNREVLEKENECPSCKSNMMECIKAIEVGHSFLLGTKYSEPLKAKFRDSNTNKILEMGCYGMGVSRLMQASVEVLNVNDQIRWPKVIAPYQVVIIPQKEGHLFEKFVELSLDLYNDLESIPSLFGEILYEDRTKMSVGRRSKDTQVRGIPYLVVISKKAVESDSGYELIDVYKNETHMLSKTQVIDYLTQNVVSIKK